MKSIDIFVDLENIGVPDLPNEIPEKVASLVGKLTESLEKDGYATHTATVFARHDTLRAKLFPATQGELGRNFYKLGWRMVWSNIDIADKALIDFARQRLQSGQLAPSALIVSMDRHFIPLVVEMRAAGREVLVCSHGGEFKRLHKAADRGLLLKEYCPGILWGVPPVVEEWCCDKEPLLNGLPLA